MRRLTIYGDNIVEAERALALVCEATNSERELLPSDAFAPQWLLDGDAGQVLVHLLPGHNAWGVDLPAELRAQGAPLREASDAIICELREDGTEHAIVALEFCSALPAGNQAWQRHGRALACAYVGLPYLIWTDTGGQELSSARGEVAGRRPSPVVPASFVTATKTYGTPCLPVYVASPSMSRSERLAFADYFGGATGVQLIRALLMGDAFDGFVDQLREKNVRIAVLLAGMRNRVDTLRDGQWDDYLSPADETDRLRYLSKKDVRASWRKSITIAIAPEVAALKKIVEETAAVSAGATNLPICVVPEDRLEVLCAALQSSYPDVPVTILERIRMGGPLVMVWVAGFKPGGDDSRPDRGLLPLARMLFGPTATVMTVVYGPAPLSSRLLLQTSPAALATQNGLWEAVINLSDVVLTAGRGVTPIWHASPSSPHDVTSHSPIVFTRKATAHSWGEQDVDSVIHTLTWAAASEGVFECLCNPPGGDWSGISVLSPDRLTEFRWTSLPRVGNTDLKRPDHVIQWLSGDRHFILAVESKDRLAMLDRLVGPKLTGYVEHLLRYSPNVSRAGTAEWEHVDAGTHVKASPSMVSAAAVTWARGLLMTDVISRGDVDLAIAVEFPAKTGEPTVVHMSTRTEAARDVAALFVRSAESLHGWIEVQIH